MKEPITVREVRDKAGIAAFWRRLHEYFTQDIFPDPEDEDRAYFLGEEYRSQIERLHGRPQDRCRYLLFCRDGQEIGFAMPVLYETEDGKCFIMEFCVFPAFRGGGTGKGCAEALLAWARERGARYFELNYTGDPRRRHFWEQVGFILNGADEWGEPLMLLPPEEVLPITVELLRDPEEPQLPRLENNFLREIGEEPLTEEGLARLRQAVQAGGITFFLARSGCRTVGMCSVATCFSTFACSDVGSFEDFYVEPAFRKNGVARALVKAALAWCRERGIASVSVCCAPCDEKMYQALGFDTPLGSTFAHLTD